jgi:hypothetical protein
VTLVADSELFATLSAARSQYAAAILGSHALAEAMLVHAAAIVWLKCSFHCNESLFISTNLSIWAAKLAIIIELSKKT